MKNFKVLLICAVLIATLAWPDISIKKLGRDIVGETGIVSNSQVDAIVAAGEKLNQANSSLTQEQEYYLGRGVSALILRQYPLYRSAPELTNYLNLVGNTLAAQSVRPEIFSGYHFAILDTEEINALSAPGGFIYVSRGFLKLIPDEDALAGVLAHEIAHVVKGHGVNAISQAHLTEAVLILGKEAASSYGPSELNTLTDAFGQSADKIFDTLIKSGYSRSQEYEADAYAATLMAKTGYSAKGLSTMLSKLGSVAGKRGGWSDTHPAPADRIASLKLPKQSENPDAYKARTERFAKLIQNS